jgi:hypothetical protein
MKRTKKKRKRKANSNRERDFKRGPFYNAEGESDEYSAGKD